ncbi:MAG: ATP-binding cassette domain-containing protein, partial [Nocardioidaceae bacterium]
MLTVHDLELRVGSRVLMTGASFGVGDGDKVGLVGRNGSGKTTLTRVLSGDGEPSAGRITNSGTIGYLPQDPRTGDLDIAARDRILSARGLDESVHALRRAEIDMASADNSVRDKAMRRYARADSELYAGGGYAAASEAATIAASLGLPDRVLDQPLRTLSGGQRRRIELARILFSGADTLLLDEPTNHLDGDSIVWLRTFLKAHKGGLIVISHDVALLDETVTRVLHLDANRAEIDVYN